MSDTLAFLPHIQESVMDELRTTEGMIFRDEGVKKLFLDLKVFVLEPLQVAHGISKEALSKILDMYLEWSEALAAEEMERMKLSKIDAVERLTGVCVLYAKYIYARNTMESSLSIRRPKMENMLKGMFTRLVRTPSVRSGSFFDLDPMRQDFLLRDIFRLSLGNDCISIIVESESEIFIKEEEEVHLKSSNEEKKEDVSDQLDKERQENEVEMIDRQSESENRLADFSEKEREELEEDNKTIGPDDSISRVMTRMEENLEREERDEVRSRTEAEAKAKAKTKSVENFSDSKSRLSLLKETIPVSSYDHSVVQSAASAMTSKTKGSEYKRPKNVVRKVVIEDKEEE